MAVLEKAVFGKSIKFSFSPVVDGELVAVNSLVSARIYSDAPTQAQKENSASGHIQEVTSWNSEGEGEYVITFAALTDSDAHNKTPYETYYIVTNFRFESGGAVKFAEEVLHVWRPDSITSRVSVTVQDLMELEPRIDKLATLSQISAVIRHAIKRVFFDLQGMGYEKARLFDLQDLNTSVKFAALSDIALSLSAAPNDIWFIKSERYNEMYERVLSNTPINYDIDGAGTPSPTDRADVQSVWLVR